MSFFGSLKDMAFAASAKAMINRQIASFGEVTQLQVDAAARSISLEVNLKGEVSPIAVRVGAYQVIDEGGQSYISFSQFSSSREWLATALNQFAAGRRFPLPASARAVL